jgi:diguanylate cyclase (GGDEF)-like protein
VRGTRTTIRLTLGERRRVGGAERPERPAAGHAHLRALPPVLGLTELEARLGDQPGAAGVVFVDLDGMKDVNRRHGHEAGDRLLRAVANRLAQAVPAGFAAPIGGDEFAMLIPGLDDPAALEWVVTRVGETLAAPFDVGLEHPVEVSATAAGAVWRPGDDPRSVFGTVDERVTVRKVYRREDGFGKLADLVAGVLDRAPDVALLDAVAGAIRQLAGADLGLVLVAGEVAFAPDLAAAGAVEIASRASAEAAEAGRFVDIHEEQWEAVAAPLGAPDALAGAVSALRRGWRFGRRERLLVAQAGRLLGPSISARRTLEDALDQIAQLSEQALRDETTGLPNRRALLRWLDELGEQTSLAVLLVDFDGLRAVNNVLGHQAGDVLIRRVAAGIQESTREDDLVARLHGSGGDEFVVCCPGLGEDEAVARAVELERHLVELRMPRALRYLYRGASVGSTVRAPGEDPNAFLERAADALRRRKVVRRTERH